MPKVKETQPAFNRRMVDSNPGIFRCDGSVLFCLLCDSDVSANQLSQVKQHLKTAKHTESAERKRQGGSSSSQSLLTTLQQDVDTNRNSSVFAMDLAKCFLEANIPLHKISHPAVVNFVEKHTKYAAPSENTLRLKYLPILYAECIDRMKKIAANNFVWISIDETTDCEQRYVANFIFGVLGVEHERGRSYLFASTVLQSANQSTIAAFFDDTLKELGQYQIMR